jgi:thiamine-phosphate pyrophosphorylase
MKRSRAESGVLRILDANLNRSREGLRVCEDVTRFVLNSDALSRKIKSLRHGIASAMKGLPAKPARLLGSRDPRGDVGRSSRLGTEMRRSGPLDIFMANMQRAKESLRVLEEFSKLVDRASAVKFQRLRFRAYEIEKKAAAAMQAGRADAG